MDSLNGRQTPKSAISVNKPGEIEPDQFDDGNKSLSQPSSGSSLQQTSATTPNTLCVVCSARSRALVLVPCGHFTVCVACGHSLQSCPTCGSNIKGLLRVYQ